MTAESADRLGSDAGRSERFHRWRKKKDKLARWAIAFGGVGVILAVVLILFYLLWVVYPLFLNPDASSRSLGTRSDWAGERTVFLALEEQEEVGFRVTASGKGEFFRLNDLQTISAHELTAPGAGKIAVASEAVQGTGLVALGLDDGRVQLVQHGYRTVFDDGVASRRVVPQLDHPFGREPRSIDLGGPIRALAVSGDRDSLVVAAFSGDRLQVEINVKEENFLTGEVMLTPRLQEGALPFEATGIAVSGDQRWIYVSDAWGSIHRFELPSLEKSGELVVGERPITELTMLLGGISVLAGDDAGRVVQAFPVRAPDNTFALRKIREFDELQTPIVRIQPEYRRKGFLALDARGTLGVYYSTAGQRVMTEELDLADPAAMALSPRARGLVSISSAGQVTLTTLYNEHPEASFSTLWGKVWYENYPEPVHVWQSSSASNDFEPKFSLTPLAFGTLKAALYAMLFAVPLALMGAAFTAYFMAPGLRRIVKPTIEIMASLPTVILGFLAGLWFAPYLEDNLASMLSVIFILPVGLFIFAWFWSQHPRLRRLVPEGWEPALLVPVMVALGWLAMVIAEPLETAILGQNMTAWISQDLGISYDQRNAVVVGIAMGFAVIPIIFSIAEDAIYGVPVSLADGSLALGATQWQTLTRVVIPTASPGIFSGLMIGLGRAVGETMIVLMATGNTPVMDWNIFEGMRTLSANIAVEMPESEVNSSHYRILFLAALVLFVFTFVVNTGAEIVRQRLRERYSTL